MRSRAGAWLLAIAEYRLSFPNPAFCLNFNPNSRRGCLQRQQVHASCPVNYASYVCVMDTLVIHAMKVLALGGTRDVRPFMLLTHWCFLLLF